MRDLIISDIHANWEGLTAVLAGTAGQYERVMCCGDLVGYGADPNKVVEWVRDHAAVNVKALALVKKLHVNPQANDTSAGLSRTSTAA